MVKLNARINVAWPRDCVLRCSLMNHDGEIMGDCFRKDRITKNGVYRKMNTFIRSPLSRIYVLL